jgi:hypothetical protein
MVKLNDWIDEQGGYKKAAAILGEGVRTVASWYRFERAPSFTSALNIYRLTRELVDFNGIYMPFADRAKAAESK